MLNVDSRLLNQVDQDGLYLLMRLADRINGSGKDVWPSNNTLLKETGWSIEKLQKVKKNLYTKGLLEVEIRRKGLRQTSNKYTIKTDFLSKFNQTSTGKSNIGFSGGIGKSSTTVVPENQVPPPTGKTNNEYISKNEVLGIEELEREKEIEIVFEKLMRLIFPQLRNESAIAKANQKKLKTQAAELLDYYSQANMSTPEYRANFYDPDYNSVHESICQIEAYLDYCELTGLKKVLMIEKTAGTITLRDWCIELENWVNKTSYDPANGIGKIESNWLIELYYDPVQAWVDKRNPERIIY